MAIFILLAHFFLSQFAHNLCDVYRATGSQLGFLRLLLLPQDDGTQAGPSLLGVLLQLSITERRQKCQLCYDIYTLEVPVGTDTIPILLKNVILDALRIKANLNLCGSGTTAFFWVSLNTEDFRYRP